MARRLSPEELDAFLSDHPGWSGDTGELRRAYAFASYAEGVAYTMMLALAAEKRDHHPDLLLRWGKVDVVWTTHDVGGVSDLDVEMATASDALYATRRASGGA